MVQLFMNNSLKSQILRFDFYVSYSESNIMFKMSSDFKSMNLRDLIQKSDFQKLSRTQPFKFVEKLQN